ncbi:response regulator, partial [Herbaspirillum lusitanum]|uniref:response regulator n=1 Tax=Herbaspirillum lusitanum TaxID=213312 RepID=UPI0039BF31C4
MIGTGYRFGGKNPDAGFDCSGMVSYIFNRAAGLKLSGSAADMASYNSGAMSSTPDIPTVAPPSIHVAIVEDDPSFRDALSKALEATPDMRLANIAGTRAEGLAMLQGPPADVLLVDLGLPDGSGIDVIHAAILRWPGCNIMVSTNFGDETHVMRSIEAGAAGYLLKDSSPAKIVDEIRSLASGGSPISPIIARQVLARHGAPGTPDRQI